GYIPASCSEEAYDYTDRGQIAAPGSLCPRPVHPLIAAAVPVFDTGTVAACVVVARTTPGLALAHTTFGVGTGHRVSIGCALVEHWAVLRQCGFRETMAFGGQFGHRAWRQLMGNKDKGGKNTKKAPAKDLKEKRADKKTKKATAEAKQRRTV